MDEQPRTPDPLEQLAAARAAAVRSLRYLLAAVILAAVAFYVTRLSGHGPSELVVIGPIEIGLVSGWQWVVLFGVALAAGAIAIDVATPRKKISTLSGVFLGLVAGILAALGVGYLVNLLDQVYEINNPAATGAVKLLFGIALVYLAISIVLQTQDEFRLVIPYVEFAKQIRGAKPLLLDTSVLIDGRVLELAETGLLQAPLVIPRFVLDELQTLADADDRLKRARGRRGLDLVVKLQKSPALDVTIDEGDTPGKSVDQMLVALARRMPAVILTNDAALNRVASIQGVAAINLHDVANALKARFLPGEAVTLRIVKPGEQPGQGVGYLEDGTMVVVEDGGGRIGEEATAIVMSSLQTTAGRLLFARINASDPAAEPAALPTQQHLDAAPPAPDDGAPPDARRDRPGPYPPVRPDRARSGFRNPRRG